MLVRVVEQWGGRTRHDGTARREECEGAREKLKRVYTRYQVEGVIRRIGWILFSVCTNRCEFKDRGVIRTRDQDKYVRS